ncbi:hypothetical protein A3K34_03455 [candidate division WWE3 bacterium RIFOXYC1_FULL_40_10]|uniref:Nudix hydrolase domain-containing protein n=1 Tax=candidate division WWE3 bacterium RIFOXYA2_FULL_46_9 TaxID=1802636 RepID=A0A1F4VYN3_UNCKA|nr:MAG: hypothetical protein A3K58_03455 [candidate division WWE3 bacterium RIFOXYB1_FULL_40_22]OGC61905.1 MAG: hypothetical protein A3K37_03455 [candidate division WWE3 bacterium RIFOXYA1_FULL_40_11]OGC62272.1 MAG: hypothetical protein A2264_03215 [candidate division WWE3 bacterium RIFOXYA2_FULL_46_9]OGC64375.1 MAG: hypothetical protein A2326_00880 [candidate division WWE3 bacterium RIFOXYB2_FULL_41_6]OGC66288.1 MAG: hypothetical protein A3K34_03455 [candidate division WWE3 bacterium RIFOXYC1_
MIDLGPIRKEGMRPTVIACVVFDNQLLLLHRKDYNLWLIPQGGVRFEENLEEALYREISEELGNSFAAGCEKKAEIIGEASAEFFPKDVTKEEMEFHLGKGVEMKGKHYFFMVVNHKTGRLDVKDTGFDDYFWMEYIGAKRLLSLMRQKKKREILLKILDLLKSRGIIR